MNITGQIKVIGDAYPGGFANGLTMINNGSMERFEPVYEDEKGKLYRDDRGLELKVQQLAGEGVTEVITSVTNTGSEAVTLELITSFVLPDLKIDKLHRLQSCWSAEGKLKTESIVDLHIERSWNGCAVRVEKFGTVGSMPVRKYFPFAAVEDSETGLITAVQLYTASSWQMELTIKNEHTYTLSGGIADRDYGQWTKKLQPGETFTAPKAVIAQGYSMYDVCDALVKAQKPAISENDSDMDIIFNEYCTTWGNPTFENVKRIADKIAGKGIKFLVIDSGWYGHFEDWWESVGEWEVNEKRFPGGMKPIADYIRSKGMIPGLWFEQECVTSNAKYYNDLDKIVLKDGYPLTVGNHRFWDMENPDAIQYLTDTEIKILKDAGFGYLKVDYNDTMGMGCDGPEGPGENLRRKIEASRAFFRKIHDEIPGIVIENCSSGGHRLTPAMMELVSQASFSDAHETKAIPLIAANMHRVIRPEQSQIWAVMRAEDSDERIYYSVASTFLGRMCLSGDIYNMSDHQWQLIEEGMAFYRRAAEIIRSGKTTLIDTAADSYNKPESQQLVLREWQDEMLLIFHRFENSENLETILSRNNLDMSKYTLVETYGAAETDFSAVAMILKRN